jgi:hypothetical protein
MFVLVILICLISTFGSLDLLYSFDFNDSTDLLHCYNMPSSEVSCFQFYLLNGDCICPASSNGSIKAVR